MAGDPSQPIISLDSAGAMPLVGLGTVAPTGSQCHRAVRYALEVGYRHLDTATMYHNEHEVGQAVRDSSLPRGGIRYHQAAPRGRGRATAPSRTLTWVTRCSSGSPPTTG